MEVSLSRELRRWLGIRAFHAAARPRPLCQLRKGADPPSISVPILVAVLRVICRLDAIVVILSVRTAVILEWMVVCIVKVPILTVSFPKLNVRIKTIKNIVFANGRSEPGAAKHGDCQQSSYLARIQKIELSFVWISVFRTRPIIFSAPDVFAAELAT